MASGSHYGQGREFRQLNQGKPHGFLHHVSNHSAADKNMKEISSESLCTHQSQTSVCVQQEEVVVASQCVEAGSKMAGPGNKYSDYFTELSKDHDAMTRVLFGRNLRLNVALTLWRRNASELVAYLIRIEDTGVLLDCLPVITKSLQDETPCISLGCCVDLLPQVKSILTSEYEEHLIVVLHWVQSVVKKWWPELSTNGKSLLDSCSEDRNLQVMKQQLKEFWVEGPQLSLVPGTTGEMAKAIESYLSQLH
ncbi:KATNB1-like protein 1 isoform X2 [Salmo salar]|uniref:KATNB1-like protein 1 isoform X2 n=1 Tax=Salmo salar TaxID=8030 RepID=A0A1S3SB58_SALSA|nr:KATNB1-like protein 1 isoform X2 [Salmo salar]|eukprot:XP_014061570.1 PREDICTED: KATNB1-like protein 1 isoform X2 [Salmo salar]